MAFRRGEVLDALQQCGVAMGAHLSIAKFAAVGALDLATELRGHGLHAVANAQHWNAKFKHRIGRTVIHLVHTGVAARQDHALELAVGGESTHPLAAHVARMNLAIHMGLTHAPCDELGNLGAKVEDEDLVVLHGSGDRKK